MRLMQEHYKSSVKKSKWRKCGLRLRLESVIFVRTTYNALDLINWISMDYVWGRGDAYADLEPGALLPFEPESRPDYDRGRSGTCTGL